MKRLFACVLAVISFVSLGHAQQRAVPACRLMVDIHGGRITTPAPNDTVSCFYNGKIIVVGTNFDDVKYELSVTAFRLDSANPTVCSESAAGKSPMKDNSREIKFDVPKMDSKSKTKDLKLKEGNMRECFEFDVVIFANSVEVNRVDPQLEVTDPPPPPPPPAPPVKKPGV